MTADFPMLKARDVSHAALEVCSAISVVKSRPSLHFNAHPDRNEPKRAIAVTAPLSV